MSKKNVKSGKNVKKDSLSDINEATKASKDMLNMFPETPAPKKRGRPKKEQPADAPVKNEQTSEQFPAKNWDDEINTTEKVENTTEKVETVETVETVGSLSELENTEPTPEPTLAPETEPTPEPEIKPEPTPTLTLEEQKLEIWLKGKDLSNVNHFELASSGAVNFNTFLGMVEGKVGKFKFKRMHLGSNWIITIEE